VVKFRPSPSLSDVREIETISSQVFGSNEPSLETVLGIADLVESAYLHEYTSPIIQLFMFIPQHDFINASAEGLNVLNILLRPQEIEGSNSPNFSDKEPESENVEFQLSVSIGNLKIWTSDDPSKLKFALVGNLKTLKNESTISNSYAMMNDFIVLPMMYFCQPLGFLLEEDANGKVYVYIFLTLLTDVNQRKLGVDSGRITKKSGILGTMLQQGQVSEFNVDSVPVIVHPFIVDDNEGKNNSKLQSGLVSPLGTLQPQQKREGLGFEFGEEIFTAGCLLPGTLKQMICDLVGSRDQQSTVQMSSSDIPHIQKNIYNAYIQSAAILTTFLSQLYKRFGSFQSLDDFVNFGHFLRNNWMLKTGNRHSVNFTPVMNVNVMHTCRLFFRAIVPRLALMIPEGNGRNYCTHLAFSRCEDIDFYLNKPLPKELALPLPNFWYIGQQIMCKYLIPINSGRISRYPYTQEIREKFRAVSLKAATDTHSSAQISCSDFAIDYFHHSMLEEMTTNSLGLPYETRKVWPQEVRHRVFGFLQGEVMEDTQKDPQSVKAPKNKSKRNDTSETEPRESRSLFMCLNRLWNIAKKEKFYAYVLKTVGVLQLIGNEFKKVENEFHKNFTVEDSINLNEMYFEEFKKTFDDSFPERYMARMTIFRAMTLYLCTFPMIFSKKKEFSLHTYSQMILSNGSEPEMTSPHHFRRMVPAYIVANMDIVEKMKTFQQFWDSSNIIATPKVRYHCFHMLRR
jgi:hypothetical protein